MYFTCMQIHWNCVVRSYFVALACTCILLLSWIVQIWYKLAKLFLIQCIHILLAFPTFDVVMNQEGLKRQRILPCPVFPSICIFTSRGSICLTEESELGMAMMGSSSRVSFLRYYSFVLHTKQMAAQMERCPVRVVTFPLPPHLTHFPCICF